MRTRIKHFYKLTYQGKSKAKRSGWDYEENYITSDDLRSKFEESIQNNSEKNALIINYTEDYLSREKQWKKIPIH